MTAYFWQFGRNDTGYYRVSVENDYSESSVLIRVVVRGEESQYPLIVTSRRRKAEMPVFKNLDDGHFELYFYVFFCCLVAVFLAMAVVIKLKINHYEKNKLKEINAKKTFIIVKGEHRPRTISSIEVDPSKHEYYDIEHITLQSSKAYHRMYPRAWLDQMRTGLNCFK